jgi:hypothetical protein
MERGGARGRRPIRPRCSSSRRGPLSSQRAGPAGARRLDWRHPEEPIMSQRPASRAAAFALALTMTLVTLSSLHRLASPGAPAAVFEAENVQTVVVVGHRQPGV